MKVKPTKPTKPKHTKMKRKGTKVAVKGSRGVLAHAQAKRGLRQLKAPFKVRY